MMTKDDTSTFRSGRHEQTMNNRQITETLKRMLKMDLTVEDISACDIRTIQEIYRRFVLVWLDIPEHALVQFPLEVEIGLPSVLMETYNQTAIPLALIASAMFTFVSDFVPESERVHFTMCDLINPNHARTRKLLSIICEFLIFYEKSVDIFTNTQNEFEDSQKELHAMREQLRVVEEKQRKALAEKDTRQRKENELNAELGRVKAQLVQAIAQCEQKEISIGDVKKEADMHTELTNELMAERETLMAQVDKLDSELLSSPERVMNEITEQRENENNHRLTNEKTRKANAELMHRLDLCSAADREFGSLLHDLNRLHTIQTEIGELGEKISAENRDLDDINKKLRDVKLSIKQEDDRREQMVANEDEAEKDHRIRLEQLLDKRQALDDHLAHAETVVREYDIERQHLKREIAMVQNDQREKTRQTKEYIDDLLQQCKIYAAIPGRKELQMKEIEEIFTQELQALEATLEKDVYLRPHA